MTTINIHEFSKKFSDNYDWLYNYNGNDYDDVVAELCFIFDNYYTKKHKDFVVEFIHYRMDYLTSDRECAAFVLTMEEMANEVAND